MINFERTKQEIQGTDITITSWLDPQTQVWRASAPAYTHVMHKWPSAALQGSTRIQAMKNLIALLNGHLQQTQGQTARR